MNKENDQSKVHIILLDALNAGISGLKVAVKIGNELIHEGVTDAQGKIGHVHAKLGDDIGIYVKRFLNDEMKLIKVIKAFSEEQIVKLYSPKVKREILLQKDIGTPGNYQRKTYQVKGGNTLASIAKENKTTVEALVRLNNIRNENYIAAGQILKLPLQNERTSGHSTDHAPAPVSVAPSKKASHEHATPAQKISGHSGTDTNIDAPVSPTTPSDTVPVQLIMSDKRGKNGTPKSEWSAQCDESHCIKFGDKGPLIEELSIRLAGFGGFRPDDTFSLDIEKAVKQFQRDYMGVAETGKVCGSVLFALDEFKAKYPINLDSMKCHCNGTHCEGFGNSSFEKDKQGCEVSPGEYPGIHRSVYWILRAMLFYLHTKEKDLGYTLKYISSGYRCTWWNKNNAKSKTTNHMGSALDIHFNDKHGNEVRDDAGLNKIREQIFVNYMGALRPGARDKSGDKIYLESTSEGAKSWVHFDIARWKKEPNHRFSVTRETVENGSILEMARREGKGAAVVCGGRIPPPIAPTIPAIKTNSSSTTNERKNVHTMSLSDKGIQFIKSWEKLRTEPYEDSSGYCTIGWGHLIDGKNSCRALEKKGSDNYYRVIASYSEKSADEDLKNDLIGVIEKVKKLIAVPLYQHEFDALVCLAFNTNKLYPVQLAKLNSRDYQGCCNEFADITNGGLPGLVKRRKHEMEMFLHNKYILTH